MVEKKMGWRIAGLEPVWRSRAAIVRTAIVVSSVRYGRRVRDGGCMGCW